MRRADPSLIFCKRKERVRLPLLASFCRSLSECSRSSRTGLLVCLTDVDQVGLPVYISSRSFPILTSLLAPLYSRFQVSSVRHVGDALLEEKRPDEAEIFFS